MNNRDTRQAGHIDLHLKRENEELREELVQVYAILRNEAWQCPPEWKLPPGDRNVLAALVARPICSLEHLFAAGSPRGACSDGEMKVVKVRICRVRKSLKPHGLVIKTLYGIGYALEPESRERLQNWGKETT